MTEATQSTEVSRVGAVSRTAITESTTDDFPIGHKAVSTEMDIRWYMNLYETGKWTLENCIDSIITELQSMKYFSMGDQGEDVPNALESMDATDTKENRDRVREFLLKHYGS